MLRCSACGTLHTAFLADSPEEGVDYGGYYRADDLELPAFVERRLGEVADQFDCFRELNRWLDVGCGRGALLRAAGARGWGTVGTDLSPVVVDAGRAAGLEVHLGHLDDLPLEDASFDVVSLIEVVEHVDEPDALVASAGRLLRPGGAMYLTTPHGRGLSARLLGAGWSVVAPPEHLQLFSVSGLRMMIARAGLIPRTVRAHAVNPHELLAAIRRPGATTTTGDRKKTAYRLNESLSENALGARLKDATNAGLSILRLGDALKVVAERPG
jgi:SAM-dependent methyltransferase